MEKTEALLQAAEQVMQILERHRVDAVVIGAVAMAAHPYVRFTHDMDLGVNADVSTLHAIASSLCEAGFAAELREPDGQAPLGGCYRYYRAFWFASDRQLCGSVSCRHQRRVASGVQRLIGYLLRDGESAQTGVSHSTSLTVNLPASKATIASLLSLTPEYFSRVLHELEAQGLIQIDKREISILDVARLASFGSN